MGLLESSKLPSCAMARIILHWTAGTYTASALDRQHYHILVQGDGSIVYGEHPIDANAKPVREPRASHTRNCNTGSIGVAMCGMKDARERPFSAGSFPLTEQQWRTAARVVAELCAQYGIEAAPRTVLAHGEVQEVLKIEQLGKWDPLVMPWAPATPRPQVMDSFRALVRDALAPAAVPQGVSLPAPPAVFQPQTQDWPSDTAVLLVHGVGNAKPGDYADLIDAVKTLTGGRSAVYTLFYDVFNDWFQEKTQFANQIGRVTSFIRQQEPTGDTELNARIADFAGDVIWPLFSLAARSTVRSAYMAQLRQMVLDGTRSTGKLPGELKLSIVCHSLGCLHTYEVLHTIASESALNLRPGTDGVRFQSVVFMASPVQLIRTMGKSIGGLVPSGLSSVGGTGLNIPFETVFGVPSKSVARWVSITGDMDPVGGHFLRKKADWAYMNVTEPESIFVIDPQQLVPGVSDTQSLLDHLRRALSQGQPPAIDLQNPHSWLGYVKRHEGELSQWLA